MLFKSYCTILPFFSLWQDCVTVLNNKSADFRHTLSWLTTSHHSLWDSLHWKCSQLRMAMLFCFFRGGDSDSDWANMSCSFRNMLQIYSENFTKQRILRKSWWKMPIRCLWGAPLARKVKHYNRILCKQTKWWKSSKVRKWTWILSKRKNKKRL